MRRLSVLLLAALLLSVGTAFAQTDQTVTVAGDLTDPVDDTYWIGLSLGFPLGGSVHFGINDLLGNAIDTRFNASFSGSQVAIGANAVFDFAINTNLPLEVYAAVGPTLVFGDNEDVGDLDNDGSGFGIAALAGAEYRFTNIGFQPGGAFFEIGPFFGFDFDSRLAARLGINYHF